MSAPFLQPFSFPRGNKVARNRMVVAAMTNTQSHADGTLSDDEHRWLRMRADGDFAIVTTCAAHVALSGQGFRGQLGVFADDHIPGLRRLADDLRAAGALCLAQLYHGGARSPRAIIGQTPISASDSGVGDGARAADERDLADIVEQFAAAAARCACAGMDGCEIHGAHGYLFSQFLSPTLNKRNDGWGGGLPQRARFLLDTVDAIRAAVPDDFLVGVRLTPESDSLGITMAESEQVAVWLVEHGVDFIHTSNIDSFRPPDSKPGETRPLTACIRSAIGKDVPLIATGGIVTPADAATVMTHGADFIGMARAAIGNPRWPKLAAAEADYAPRRPPYTVEELQERGVGPAFVEYLRPRQGFIADS